MTAPPAKPQPKNPGFITATIDGKEVVVKPGTNMIEAARNIGSEIPYYCYHPKLSIAANCRMCLVETNTAPKLVPACQTPLTEGMAVKTTTPKVKDNQRSVLEFLLLSHPVDCSICDQAGECKLQDYYMRYDHQPSRLDGAKVLKAKRRPLGPQVVLDQERCILCTRCVRFMSEVAKEPQLGLFGRGNHEAIDIFPGQPLDSNYSMNTVDLCPVGALLSRDFRFRARAWFLSAAPSVCNGCSRGCNVYADFMGQDTYRYRPRLNEAVNQNWMCDHGRLTYKQHNAGRAPSPLVGRGQEAKAVSGAEAVQEAAAKLSLMRGNKGLAVVASPLCSNEELLAALTFAKQVLGVTTVHVGGRPEGKADHFLLTADRNPNRKGLEQIAGALGLTLSSAAELSPDKVKALYVIGGELPLPEDALETLLSRLELFVLQSAHLGTLARHAHVLLPATTHIEDEGTFTQLDGITQRFRPAYPARGAAQPNWKWAAELSTALGNPMAFKSAREVWRALSPAVPELASFEWDAKAPATQKRGGLSPLPAAADGRPPGWREGGVPRLRGI